MKNHSWSLITAFAITGLSVLYALPWQALGVELPFQDKAYKLGLDLHGGVELDYKVDFDARTQRAGVSHDDILEGLKGVVEKRVNSIGTAEPTIFTSTYGKEKHIIVQIPTQAIDPRLSADERSVKNREFIQKAKDTVGKVVRLEFKEEKTQVTDADRAQRRAIADAFATEVKDSLDAFATVATKFQDQHENVTFQQGTGTYAQLPGFVRLPEGKQPSTSPFLSSVFVAAQEAYSYVDGQIKTTQEPGFSVVQLTAASGAQNLSSTGTVWAYEALFVAAKPSSWTPAIAADGNTLDERYLVQATSGYNPQQFKYEVNLRFNDEGARIFADISKRLVGKPMAIFVGGQLLTAPIIQQPITGGQAQITGNYTRQSAEKLANDINTGIVPAPIYLTSEQTIDPKLGIEALQMLVWAGILGFLAILVFLVVIYRLSGLISALSLLAYLALTLAAVKAFGVVLTLAALAGLILSLGIAIDANILMLERAKDELRAKQPLAKALRLGLERSWSAIWDSNLTGFIVAVILFIFGVSLVKSFGIMLALGIMTSLIVIRYVAYPITLALAGKFETQTKAFINFRG